MSKQLEDIKKKLPEKKVWLVTGATGQDASYLFEHLYECGQEIHGLIRRSSSPEYHTKRIDHIVNPEKRNILHFGDLTEGLDNVILEVKPDYIVNLAAMSHVFVSFQQPIYTAETNAVGVLRLLESIRRCEKILGKQIRFYQASSSEIWGSTPPIQDENSIMAPCSPYGVSKLFAYHTTKIYRKSYGMFASNGILHNHSSVRRGITFATRKITRAVARITLGLQDKLYLGNLDAIRDEGKSSDYMKAVLKIILHDKPDDFVVATGESHTIREWAEKTFKFFNLDMNKHVIIIEDLKRPSEVNALVGDSTKARTLLGWEPEYTYQQLLEEMCLHDYEEALKEKHMIEMEHKFKSDVDKFKNQNGAN